jgi:large subunit ribosomal protein L31
MKPNVHPEYLPVTITCACGAAYKTRSGRIGDFNVDICGACHPFFTGKIKLIDTEGRVQRFRNKYKSAPAGEKTEKKAEAAPATEAKGEKKGGKKGPEVKA